MAIKEKGYGGVLAVVSHTLNGPDMQGLTKGLGLFFHSTAPIAVFVGSDATMVASGNLLQNQLHNVEEVNEISALDEESGVGRERLLKLLLNQINTAFMGVIVVANTFYGGYLLEGIHAKGTYRSPRQMGYALGINNFGVNYLLSPDGSVREDNT